MHYKKRKTEILLYFATTFLILAAYMERTHAEPICQNSRNGACHIVIDCARVKNLKMDNLIDIVKSQDDCVGVNTHQRCCRNGYYFYEYSYNIPSSTVISLNIDYNIDSFWSPNSDLNFDSHINSISFNAIDTIPRKIKNFENLNEIEFVNYTGESFDLNSFLGFTSLLKIKASSNFIKVLNSNTGTESGYAQFIDLSHNKIKTLPNLCFSKFNELKNLNLSHNFIKNIEILTFEGISKLEVLDLSFNSLTDIHQSLVRFIDLKELFISNNNLINLSGTSLKTMTKLEKLNLRNNLIKSIDVDAFRTLAELKELDISYNILQQINFDASSMKKLTKFHAENNNIRAVKKIMLHNFESLEELDLAHNSITKLEPLSFVATKNLKYLNVSDNIIENPLTANFFQGLENVVNIELSENKFTCIENDTFNGLHNLISLNISHCNIVSLGYDAFKNSGSIQILDLSNNALQNISLLPESLDKIKEIYIYNNTIRHFNKETFAKSPEIDIFNAANNSLLNDTILLTSAKNLTYVDISNTKTDVQNFLRSISTVSKLSMANIRNRFSFENIHNITIVNLDLSCNDIDNVNQIFIFNVRNLTRLDLKINKITLIDRFSFQDMPSLTWLDLSSNLIAQIQPGSFLHTINILDLNLYNNSMATLKFGIFEGLENLITLNMSNNMINEFSVNYLHNTPKLSNIILDNNQIKDIDLKDFSKSNVTLISIGGNPLSCHIFANFKHNNTNDNLRITAEIFDYHSDNFNGIKCSSGFDLNDNTSKAFPRTVNDVNGTTALMYEYFSKELANFRIAIEVALRQNDIKIKNVTEFLKSIDNNTNILANLSRNILIMNEHLQTQRGFLKNERYNVTDFSKFFELKNILANLSKYIFIMNEHLESQKFFIEHNNATDLSKSIDFKNILANLSKNILIMNEQLESQKEFYKKLTSINITETNIKHLNLNETNVLDQNLNEKLKIMNGEKEKLVKEIQTIFEELKSSSERKTEADTEENGLYKNNDIKVVLYFVAGCLMIIIIMLIAINGYKIFKNKPVLQRNNIFNSSSQPISNDMELPELA